MAELPVALDAMGGDNGPAPNVEGAIAAVREDGARVILVGNEATLAPLVPKGVDGIEIRHAPDVVTMDDKPVAAARKKKESSMRKACDLVGDGEAGGALSAGNSGAMMAMSLLVFGRIDGVMRPAIGTMVPSLTDIGLVMLVDAGANIDCEPAHLAQWAVLGSEHVKRTFAVTSPKIGVLSNGEEDQKGTDLTRAALELVRKLPLHVHGYVEGRDLNTGVVHVIVTDGFTGNVMLKTAEGVFKFVTGRIRDGYERGSLKEKIGALLSQSMFERMRRKLDPREFGAAPLLGLAKPAFIAHGSSDAYSIRRGIGAVRSYAKNDLVGHMAAAIALATPLLEQKKGA
jgi:glycerol-3-phosphate acyltransferase PlsX